MQVLEENTLFTDISAEESEVVSGGRDAAIISVSTPQIVFALGASLYTKLLTGSEALAFSVLETQYNRAFDSVIH